MTPTRAAVEARLSLIRGQLAEDRPLTKRERDMLCQAIDRALSGESNPFRIPASKPTTRARDIRIAEFILATHKAGVSVEVAKTAATGAAEFDGANRDAVDRAWKRHRAEVVGNDALYQARNAGRQMTAAEQLDFQKGLDSAFPD